MAKNLKLKIKNTQIAQAVNLGNLKKKLAKRKADDSEEEAEKKEKKAPAKKKPTKKAAAKKAPAKKEPAKKAAPKKKAKAKEAAETPAEEQPAEVKKVRARTKSRFAETGETLEQEPTEEAAPEQPKEEAAPPAEEEGLVEEVLAEPEAVVEAAEVEGEETPSSEEESETLTPKKAKVKLGPTGRHINDILPKQYHKGGKEAEEAKPKKEEPKPKAEEKKAAPKPKEEAKKETKEEEEDWRTKKGKGRIKEYRDVKPLKKQAGQTRGFDARDRMGLRHDEEGSGWRKRRSPKQQKKQQEDLTIRPAALKVRLPITVKDLAVEMKLKSSQLISKLFMQGLVITLNDFLDDETTIQLLGQEFDCEITIDTSEEERIRITDKTIREEIKQAKSEHLALRPPVVAFMGHVDHGKTSLIDKIRSTNRVAGEAGAITQHIGAFLCETSAGPITILDTPGHEAFSAMRARGAEVTDIVVLVIAGDEGMRQQTIEAMQHAKAAGVSIVVAINKSDKPNFDAENVYRQLSENELLPEAWGGQTITVNCSAVTGEGITTLLEMLALQAEVLELKADAKARARGSVIESEMHKGLGIIATVLVQNGTLKPGDAVVFEQTWGRIKTMRDEHGRTVEEAGPSHAVEITGLDALPTAGEEFIVVRNEKEARDIAEVRQEEQKQTRLALQKRPMSVEHLLQQAADEQKKVLNVVLRADVQGSLEALKVALTKIESEKVMLNVIFSGVGEISESDVQLAAASKAVVIGFHTQVESHAEQLIKQTGTQVRLFDVIYHAVNSVKEMLADLLDKVAIEVEKGVVEVRAVFKSSQLGNIAGCYVKEGAVNRNNYIRVEREGEEIWKGPIASLKRVKEDVKEVAKGLECGIVLQDFQDIKEGDLLHAFEITYKDQEL